MEHFASLKPGAFAYIKWEAHHDGCWEDQEDILYVRKNNKYEDPCDSGFFFAQTRQKTTERARMHSNDQ